MSTLAEVKALELTGDPRISFADGVWTVPSQTSPSVRYQVNPSLASPSCTCEHFQLTARPCKHIESLRLLLDRQIKGEPPPPVLPRPPRPTYRQRWVQYNAAQTNEKDHFQALLADLCQAVPELPRKDRSKGGRPPAPIGDALFTAIFKVYSGFSARRFASDLREAAERGHVRTETSFGIAWTYLQKPEVTPILHELIRRSSLPLRSVDVDFAVDSSGFGTCKFETWIDEKYGVPRRKARWVKCHLCVGVKTNVVTAVYIGDKDAGDAPQFPELVKGTAQSFTVREVSADKAYLSGDNLAVVDGLGGTPFIPFKVNSVLGNTPLWDRMFHYFQMRRDEFLTHYHKRSNVESTFSAIKRLFGDAVRSKSDVAMMNEALAKIVLL
jgi:transposase